MQYMQLLLENENGNKIAESEVNFGNIINSLDLSDKNKFPWLFAIDPYGITLFNLHQVPHVLKELEQLSSEVENESLKKEIISTIDFMSQIKQHTYIKLIGD